MAETQRKKWTPRDLLRMVFRRWKFFLLSASLFAMIVMVGGQMLPLKYTGETKFEARIDPVSVDSPRLRRDVEADKLTLEYELVGWGAMKKAAEDEGLTKGLPHGPAGELTVQGTLNLQELVRQLMAATRIRWDARSEEVDLVTVSFEHANPRLAERMPDTLVRNYINTRGEKTRRRFLDSRDFLRKQINDCTARLDEQIKVRQSFEAQNQDIRPQDPGYLLEQIQQVNRDLDRAQAQKTAAETKLALLGALMPVPASGPATSQPVLLGTNPRLVKLREELQSLTDRREAELSVLKKKPAHPDVVALDAMIAVQRQRIQDAQAEAGSRPALSDGLPGAPDVRGIQIQVARFEIDLAEKEIARVRVRLAELSGLQGRLAIRKDDYLKLLKKEQDLETERTNWQKQESSVQMSLDAELADRGMRLRQLQAALMQSRPSSPSLWTILGFAVVGGVGCAAGLVFLLQIVDRTITTSEEAARHFEVPVQGVVEEIITSRQRVQRRLRRWLLSPLVTVVVLVGLAAAGTNITLWLRDPDQYLQWRQAPDRFVVRKVESLLGSKGT